MLKVNDETIKKVMYGNITVKSIYYQNQRVYPNITGENTGSKTTEWVYNLPQRTRTTTSWRQDVYADGSVGEKEYGTPQIETETGNILTQEYIYSYINQNRCWTTIYQFPNDEIYESFGNTETGKIHFEWKLAFVNNDYIIPATGGSIQIHDTASTNLFWDNKPVKTFLVERIIAIFKSPSSIFTIKENTISATDRTTVLGEPLSHPLWGKGYVTLSKNETIEIESDQNGSEEVLQKANEATLSGNIECIHTSDLFIKEKGGTFEYTLRSEFEFTYSSGASRTVTNIDPSEYTFTYSLSGETNMFTEILLSYPSLIVKISDWIYTRERNGSISINVTSNNPLIRGNIFRPVLYVEQNYS